MTSSMIAAYRIDGPPTRGATDLLDTKIPAASVSGFQGSVPKRRGVGLATAMAAAG
jgi:hypothetical protein